MAKVRARLRHGTAIEIWFQDEARVGQKNKITRRWAKRGTRPSAPHDQRTASVYIFGAICPEQGKGAGLVLPFCNTATMNLHLAEIAQAVAVDAHAVLLMDQAGWHLTDKLILPDNISIIPLPAKCPELNPVENVWQFMRQNWLSNRKGLRRLVSSPKAQFRWRNPERNPYIFRDELRSTVTSRYRDVAMALGQG